MHLPRGQAVVILLSSSFGQAAFAFILYQHRAANRRYQAIGKAR